ncbi:BREX system Lon protease-like protein BrxL [Aurantimonas sp. A2-1-M11]
MGAEASFAFVGNTDHNVPYMLKNSDLFEALPPQFHDSEPPRVSRRPHFLREWGHHDKIDIEEIFAGGP